MFGISRIRCKEARTGALRNASKCIVLYIDISYIEVCMGVEARLVQLP